MLLIFYYSSGLYIIWAMDIFTLTSSNIWTVLKRREIKLLSKIDVDNFIITDFAWKIRKLEKLDPLSLLVVMSKNLFRATPFKMGHLLSIWLHASVTYIASVIIVVFNFCLHTWFRHYHCIISLFIAIGLFICPCRSHL